MNTYLAQIGASTSEDYSLENQKLIGSSPAPESQGREEGVVPLGITLPLVVLLLVIVGYLAFRIFKNKKQKPAHV